LDQRLELEPRQQSDWRLVHGHNDRILNNAMRSESMNKFEGREAEFTLIIGFADYHSRVTM
jgi:hypothetical protein